MTSVDISELLERLQRMVRMDTLIAPGTVQLEARRWVLNEIRKQTEGGGMSFAVVRHPDIEALGVLPEGALELQRVHGWYRVSPWAPEPADLHLPDYAEVFEDLDAEPEPPAKPAPKKSRPATPASDEEQEV